MMERLGVVLGIAFDGLSRGGLLFEWALGDSFCGRE